LFRFCIRAFFLLALVTSPLCGQTAARQSIITVHAGKTGLFSGFAHNHTIAAPVERAVIDAKNMSAEISVETKKMRVLDPEVSEKDRAEIQATMLGPKVLDTEKFPEIRFTSSRIEQTSPQHYRVTGTLDLHGVRQELSFEMTGGEGHYQGKTRLKQTDFGIQPVSVAGGTVKVKNELELDFDIYSESVTNARRR
jgi:polyisoprenoid-binding protein YceI